MSSNKEFLETKVAVSLYPDLKIVTIFLFHPQF